MKTKPNCKINHRGSSLIECLVTLLTMLVGLSGMISYRYYCVNRVENTEDYTLAARTAQMIAEIWTSRKGDLDYDLSNYTFGSGFQVSPGSGSPSAIPSGSVQTGNYDIVSEGHPFTATLACQDSEEISSIRNLYVVLTWANKNGNRHSYTVSTMTQAQTQDSDSETAAAPEMPNDQSELKQELAPLIGDLAQDSAVPETPTAATNPGVPDSVTLPNNK